MNERTVLTFLVQCSLCLAIRVPVDWSSDSAVNDGQSVNSDTDEQTPQPPIYNEYFKYTANKPQFAIDVAADYGARSPEEHYKSHPVRPHTGLAKPVFGQHKILDAERNTYQPYQKYVKNPISGDFAYVTPVSTSFEVYHPYKAEEPALQNIYKDPVLDKIRNDLRDSKNRLHKYENDAGEANISKDEYLESPEQTDRKKHPHRNIPSQYEIHRPQRRPAYYRMPIRSNYREQILNHKLRHPWNQNVKVTPHHYRPVKNHLYQLRQQHALKYDDERNEYPQLPVPEQYGEKPDGYDIYEKGKAKYVQLRNNADESINKAVQENRPSADYKLELQNGYSNDDTNHRHYEEEFVPIRNYAQVRKTETTKHLPRKAALRDAQSLEEVQNAPRLREAIKSTKAQIVYSEEGYEDAAYDHAGEQKHASDHEGHGGFLKENEISAGKYQTPSISTSYGDAKGFELKDQVLDGKKWEDLKEETKDESESNDYSEEDDEDDLSDVIVDDLNIENESDRNKRNSEGETDTSESDLKDYKKDVDDSSSTTENTSEHEVIKRETSFKLPEFNFNTTLPSEEEIEKLAKIKTIPLKLKKEDDSEKLKYPYYFKNIKTLSKNSPLRYAENIDFIPKKSSGGTEFYDSRSKLECSEVEEDVDAVPEKLKKDGHPDENDDDSVESSDNKNTDEEKFKTLKNKQRLKGLGDKIDCFKVKYFGENPLDNPFFKEEIIENPEPITKPNLKVFETKKIKEKSNDKSFYYDADIFSILDKITNNRYNWKNESLTNNNATTNKTLPTTKSDLYSDIVNVTHDHLQGKSSSLDLNNKNVTTFQNQEVSKSAPAIRTKRAAPFTYEPYKIIKDSQIQDSKKTTTTSNISPLIKQLQSSRVIDKVTINKDKDQSVKNNAKVYKDIGKIDRKNTPIDKINDASNTTFVDVSSDKRKGEPRYEIRPANHKTTYSPVENKKAISVEEYKTQTNKTNDTDINSKPVQSPKQAQIKRSRSLKTTSRPYFDVSKYLPQTIESQDIAASNAVRKVIRTVPPEVITEKIEQKEVEDKADDDEEYDDYEDEEEDDDEEIDVTTTTTTTTTTKKPTIRRRTRGTTTIKPAPLETETEAPKLRLTTRFRNPSTTTKTKAHHEVIKDPVQKEYNTESGTPKYTEKKRKSTKSMLVTDTKTYGDDDDDVTRKEVDALLRVKQDMNDYMPLYEKENNKHSKNNNKEQEEIMESENGDDDDSDENENEDEDDDEDDDEDEDEDPDEEDDEESEDSKDDDNRQNKQNHVEVTTSEPTKRTLARTTVAPATTTETRSARIELKPLILKKKYEVHEETPVNKSSPHVTQFKQDIKEIEIIKQMAPKSRKKINKNIEALDLYRDENLAEEINKLGDVEVFRENLNLNSGPKHGGNYRSITPEDLKKESAQPKQRDSRNKGDVETSPTQARKLIEVDEPALKHQKSPSSNSQTPPNNEPKSAKIIELSDAEEVSPKSMHGGNLKYSRRKGTRQNNKNAKFIELDEDEDDETSKMHGGNFKSYNNRNSGRQMHGGNYRSAKIVQNEDASEKPRSRGKVRDARTNAAHLLDSYARAVPILTTTPAYILDPSKRMYYYVDA